MQVEELISCIKCGNEDMLLEDARRFLIFGFTMSDDEVRAKHVCYMCGTEEFNELV